MYSQQISISIRDRTGVFISNFSEIPSLCYCRKNESGACELKILTQSEDGKYLIAEGRSDNTCFMLLKISGQKNGLKTTEYIDSCSNPGDESCSYISAVHWFEEYGFCKLEFFNMESIMTDNIKRLYFDKKLYERKKAELQKKEG